MTIRKKLMILLFSITLIPLLGIILLYQITLSYVSNKISDDITVTLEETGRHNMLRMLNEYETNFRVNARLLETLIQLQAREVERAMAKPVAAGKLPTDHHFGLNVKLADPTNVYQNYQKTSSDGSLTPFEVSFRRQDFLITGSGNQAGISNDLQRLSKMTAEYFRIYQLNPQMIFWQYTALENGLHTLGNPNFLLAGLGLSTMDDRSGGGFFKPEDNLCRGGFATTAFTGQGEYFGWFDIKADTIRGCQDDPGEHIALGVPFG